MGRDREREGTWSNLVGGTTPSPVGYSTTEEAYDQPTPALAETKSGEGATFASSYGPSGDQGRVVEAGQPAEVVACSPEPDAARLVGTSSLTPTGTRKSATV